MRIPGTMVQYSRGFVQLLGSVPGLCCVIIYVFVNLSTSQDYHLAKFAKFVTDTTLFRNDFGLLVRLFACLTR